MAGLARSLSLSSYRPLAARSAVAADRSSAANRTAFAGTAARPVASTPRQKHQVGRFLCIPEKRLARRSHLRAHPRAAATRGFLHAPHWAEHVAPAISLANSGPGKIAQFWALIKHTQLMSFGDAARATLRG